MAIRFNWLCMAAFMVPALASAQFDFGGGAKTDKPWTEFKLNPKTRVKLNLQNSPADAVVKYFENVSGVTIVKDPALTGTLPITSAKPVPLNDAFQILSTTLGLKGYSITKEGNLLVIKQTGNGGKGGGQTGPFDPTTMGGGNDNRTALRVYPIKYANASQLARVLNDVYTPPTTNGGGFQIQRGGQGNNGGFGQNRGGFGGFGNQNQLPQVKASSDDFSNSVIVNAPDRDQGEVKTIIDSLDKPSDLPQHTKVYPLKYASATDTASVVQNVLTANVPRGRGGTTTSQQQGPQAFFNAIRGTTAGSGQVVADNRTNALIVTATDDDMKIVDDVIQSIDHNVEIQSTTFVFPLANARADSVAAIIQQAYGNKQGVSAPNSTTLNNTSSGIAATTGQSTRLSNTSTQSRTGLTGEDLSNDPNAQMAIDLPPTPTEQAQMRASGKSYLPLKIADPLNPYKEDPNAQSGELMTSIGVTGFGQGFGGGGGQRGGGFGQGIGGGSSSNNQTTYTTGHDANGQIVQTRDLTGQVTAIPDINTNSIIVVASPENAAILQKMLQQLDHIPQQVLIQTVVVEATLGTADTLGVEWNLTQGITRLLGDPTATATGGTNFGLKSTAATTTAPGFTYAISGKNFSAFLQALQTDSKFQILATPRIYAANNVQGEINVSQSVPYVTGVQTDSSGNPTYSYNFLSVGLILTIQPRILNNGYVTLDVDQTANELAGYIPVGNVSAPEVNQREATTTASVKDGDTIIIGGMISKQVTATVNKIPLLGDIPILGNLFRSSSKSVSRTELLVFLTPTIVKNPEDATALVGKTLNEVTPDTKKAISQFKNQGNNTGTGPGATPGKTGG